MQSNVSLSAAQTARVDFKLEVGTVEERIEVAATGAVLQTENAVVGQTLQREQVEKLPIQGRNLATASLYTAGVTTPNPASFNDLKNTGGGRPYVNGQREQGNNFMLDGVDMNDAIDNLIAYQPSPDAVEQVSVETNNYSPELGNVAGAVVNMVIKSGTNNVSGNAFYYWRDNDMAATPWATNRAGGRKADFNRKIFGGTVGGPIMANKLFFFGDYQGGRQESPLADSFVTVIPDEWRRGDLSSLLARATPIVVRDPHTGQPFPNNQIPVERFSPFARNLLANEALYPRANVTRAAHRLPPELPRPGRLVAEGQPVRRQGRLERLDQRQGLRPLLEADARGDAGSDRRSRCRSPRCPRTRSGASAPTGTASSARRWSTTC